jgi:hypothetical protein
MTRLLFAPSTLTFASRLYLETALVIAGSVTVTFLLVVIGLGWLEQRRQARIFAAIRRELAALPPEETPAQRVATALRLLARVRPRGTARPIAAMRRVPRRMDGV